MLEVVARLASHDDAAAWYLDRGLPVPSNCMVAGNDPIPLERTSGGGCDVCEWDAAYRRRAASYPAFLVCRARHLALDDPPIVTETAAGCFRDGRIPLARTPRTVTRQEAFALLRHAGIPDDVIAV